MSGSALLIAAVSAVAAVVLWSVVVLIYGYLAVPAEMELEAGRGHSTALKERDAAIGTLTAERDTALASLARFQNPQEQIRIVNQHISYGQKISGRLRTLGRDRQTTEQQWTLAVKDEMDWLRSASTLVESLCVSKKHDMDMVWLSVPSQVRIVGTNPDGSPFVDGSRFQVRDWINNCVKVLLDCIERIDRRPVA